MGSEAVPDQTLLPSNHEKPKFEPHSTLIGKHDVKHRVERYGKTSLVKRIWEMETTSRTSQVTLMRGSG